MAFFDELGKKAKDVAEIVAEKAIDAAEIVSEKAKDVADITKIKVEIRAEQRELEKNYRAIGEWFASEYDGEIPEAVKDVMAAISASKDRIAQLEELKASVGENDDDDKTVYEGEVILNCPVCATPSTNKFCPECGAPMAE